MITTFEELLQKMESDKIKTGALRIRLMKYHETCQTVNNCLNGSRCSSKEFDRALVRKIRQDGELDGILTGLEIIGYVNTGEKIRLGIELDKMWEAEEGTDHEESTTQV